MFTRSSTVAWRDTGIHVLALPTRPRTGSVVLLTGIGATIWRLLDQPRTAADIRTRMAGTDDPTSVDTTLGDLIAAGLLSAGRGR